VNSPRASGRITCARSTRAVGSVDKCPPPVKKDETKASTGVAAPKPRRSTRRRLLRATGLVALALALLLAFHPIWQPWVMGPVLRQYGVAFSAYDRIGYSRFALLDGTFEKDGISFDFKRLEAPTAGALLWTRCFRNDASKTSRPTLNLAGWRLEITPASSPTMTGRR
jgi:hypothetical protein